MSDQPARRRWPAAVEGTRFAEVRAFEELDSTNRYLLAEARAGAPEGVVAVADFQTGGRGRLGRTWNAPPGASLLVSVLLRPPLRADRAHLLTMAVAMAMADAVASVAGFEPELKWPNDLVIGERKLAGLLAEVDLGPDGSVRAVVVGIGVNVCWDELPPELVGIATACNLVAGRDVSRADLLVAFLRRLDARCDALDRVLFEYRRRLSTIGRRVRAELPSGTVVGTAVDVDHRGALLVETGPGCVVEVAAGDVVHLRLA
jgi:BirA family transcriptional regulator, biotin operon repressor / biotin---[acetyl-CoA-carboxylase] ligase